MRCYSIFFKREKIKGVEDILWFGRIVIPYYKNRPGCEEGGQSQGVGPGLQLHVLSSCHGTCDTDGTYALLPTAGDLLYLDGKGCRFRRWLGTCCSQAFVS